MTRTTTVRRAVPAALALLAVALPAGAGRGGPITLLDQSRVASAEAHAACTRGSGCPDEATAADGALTHAPGRFEANVVVVADAGADGTTAAIAAARQNSDVRCDVLAAIGTACISGESVTEGRTDSVRSDAESSMRVVFDLSTPTPFALAGTLATTARDALAEGTSVRFLLTGPEGPLFDATASPILGDVGLDATGVLDPGGYVLVLRALAGGGTGAAPTADASYEITLAFDVACGADLDGDGAVGVADLLALLGAWGACPRDAPCPADLDASGAVDVADVLLVLASWG